MSIHSIFFTVSYVFTLSKSSNVREKVIRSTRPIGFIALPYTVDFNQFVLEEAREVQCEMVYSEYYKKWIGLNYGADEYMNPGVRMINKVDDVVDELLTCVAFHTLTRDGFKEASVLNQIDMVRGTLKNWVPVVSPYVKVTDDHINHFCNTVMDSLYK